LRLLLTNLTKRGELPRILHLKVCAEIVCWGGRLPEFAAAAAADHPPLSQPSASWHAGDAASGLKFPNPSLPVQVFGSHKARWCCHHLPSLPKKLLVGKFYS